LCELVSWAPSRSAQMMARLRPPAQDTLPLDEPPPPGYARWVRPELVGEVAYRTLSGDQRLRRPSWRGLRPDREPEQVRRPEEA
jgi:bifunctional non-homologous end joining protein LigD